MKPDEGQGNIYEGAIEDEDDDEQALTTTEKVESEETETEAEAEAGLQAVQAAARAAAPSPVGITSSSLFYTEQPGSPRDARPSTPGGESLQAPLSSPSSSLTEEVPPLPPRTGGARTKMLPPVPNKGTFVTGGSVFHATAISAVTGMSKPGSAPGLQSAHSISSERVEEMPLSPLTPFAGSKTSSTRPASSGSVLSLSSKEVLVRSLSVSFSGISALILSFLPFSLS